MTNSMTAFAREQFESEAGTISWEIKSLNHRYLELHLHLPDEARAAEMKLRSLIQQHISRGKIELVCRFRAAKTKSGGIAVDTAFVQDVIAACNEIEMQMGVGQALSALDVLAYPGVVDDSQQAESLDEEILLQSLDKTLNQLTANKQQEGERLKNLVLNRAKQLRDIVQGVRKHLPDVTAAIREKLEKKLNEISGNVDNDRLEQELVYLAQKMDVDEELDRLVSHLVSLQNAFTTDEPIGRRLDFLMQEFNREANTLASKSADADTTKAAVELKVLIEQMREQVQNIE